MLKFIQKIKSLFVKQESRIYLITLHYSNPMSNDKVLQILRYMDILDIEAEIEFNRPMKYTFSHLELKQITLDEYNILAQII